MPLNKFVLIIISLKGSQRWVSTSRRIAAKGWCDGARAYETPSDWTPDSPVSPHRMQVSTRRIEQNAVESLIRRRNLAIYRCSCMRWRSAARFLYVEFKEENDHFFTLRLHALSTHIFEYKVTYFWVAYKRIFSFHYVHFVQRLQVHEYRLSSGLGLHMWPYNVVGLPVTHFRAVKGTYRTLTQ